MSEPTLGSADGAPEDRWGSGRSSDGLSFEEFFEQERERVYRALCLISGAAIEADEAVQEAFAIVLERWTLVRGMARPAGYLHEVALNVLRRKEWRTNLLRRIFHNSPESGEIARAEPGAGVGAALASLPTRQRSALVVTGLLGYGSDEAGRMLGLSGSTVRALSSRGRAAIREAMELADG
jgi:RNA polymerase sigma factor (sigma-70 family)